MKWRESVILALLHQEEDKLLLRDISAH
jgi:hypothetical protein